MSTVVFTTAFSVDEFRITVMLGVNRFGDLCDGRQAIFAVP